LIGVLIPCIIKYVGLFPQREKNIWFKTIVRRK